MSEPSPEVQGIAGLPDADEALAFADAVADRIGRNVLALAAVVRIVAIAGLVAGGVALLAIVPWAAQAPGALAPVLVVVLLLVVAVPPVALLRHRQDLVEAYGDGELLEDQVAGLGTSAQDAYHRLMAIESAKPEGRFRILRWSWGYLRHVRTIWKAGFGSQFRKLAEPIEPTRLARSAWFGLWSVATCLLAGPIVVVSVLAAVLSG